MLGYDTETTGLDLWHGCTPFAACIVDDQTRKVHTWRWDVDPYCRKPSIPVEDVIAIGDLLASDEVVMHNASFDMRVTEILFGHPRYHWHHEWQWEFIHDSMIASHVFRNLWSHGLKKLRKTCLRIGGTSETILQRAVNEARRIVRRKKFLKEYGQWEIAGPNHRHSPGMTRRPTSGWWVMDMWLPREIMRLAPEFLPREETYLDLTKQLHYEGYTTHPWENIAEHYCNEDAQTCLGLHKWLRMALEKEGLWDQYLERMRVLRAAYEIEGQGLHVHHDVLKSEQKRYEDRASLHADNMKFLVENKDFNPQSPTDLSRVLYGDLQLPALVRTEGGSPSTKEEALDKLAEYCETHDVSLDAANFMRSLRGFRRNTKANTYLSSYEKWSTFNGRIKNIHWARPNQSGSGMVPNDIILQSDGEDTAVQDRDSVPGWARVYVRSEREKSTLHAGINVIGTRFTRQSSSNPNLQNVGTGKEEDGKTDFQLRKAFGPKPGRIWVSIDYANIELRIWAYLCGNREFIQAFKEDQSIHLLICRELHPELSHLSDTELKKTLEYKWTKNGDFAIIYGATELKANLTYKVRNAFGIISGRFPEVKSFTMRLHREVEKRGYIETLTGYRLYIPKSDPHKAVSGKVQGTAGSVIGRAMYLTHEFLSQEYPDGHLIIQVHDELVFDLPENVPAWVLNKITDLMEGIGDDIEIPLKVDAEVTRTNWAEGEALCLDG